MGSNIQICSNILNQACIVNLSHSSRKNSFCPYKSYIFGKFISCVMLLSSTAVTWRMNLLTLLLTDFLQTSNLRLNEWEINRLRYLKTKTKDKNCFPYQLLLISGGEKSVKKLGNITQHWTATLHALSVKGGTHVLVKDKKLFKQQQVHSPDIWRVEHSSFVPHLFHAVISQNLLTLSLKCHFYKTYSKSMDGVVALR